MEFRTPLLALSSVLVSLAAEAGGFSTQFTLPHPKVCAEFNCVIDDASRQHGVRSDLIRAIIQT